MDKGYYKYIVIEDQLNAGSKNVVLATIGVIAVAGLAFAFIAGLRNQISTSVDQPIEAEQNRIAQERLRTTIYYGYYNVEGNIECISSKASGTPSIEIYAENVYTPESVIDFTLTADRNAAISLEESDGFQKSATKRLTVIEGSQTLFQIFYVKPHANATDIQLTLDAVAIDPPYINLVSTMPSNTIVFAKEGLGNYCSK